MKVKICNKCQFRTLAENKICRTCGSREFTDFEVVNFPETMHMPKLDSNWLKRDWKNSIPSFANSVSLLTNALMGIWDSILKFLNSTPSELSQRRETATRRVRDLTPAIEDDN
ncbi:MAG: hypothetical protein DKT66_06310 [Candidatus Melainabacteria bacterium]|nr:MAG: hypothetical protein DKT66_06310 [Candidatus Melainabacteria bacterium]